MSINRKVGKRWLAERYGLAAAALLAAVLVPRGAAFAASEQVLYRFCSQADCTDGYDSRAGLVMDGVGNLYGTATDGGGASGVVFALAPDGTYTVLYSFCPQAGCPDGAHPYDRLVMDAAGNLYGTTRVGGTAGAGGAGVVFMLAPNGAESVLYSFCQQAGCADGSNPFAGLLMDAAGNLYGTTRLGGGANAGVVFRLAPDGTYTVLYGFCPQPGCADGANQFAGLVMDGAGNLYGTTANGGASGKGVVFQLAPDGTQTVLYSFCTGGVPCADGASPFTELVIDAAGNLYGTTSLGGTGGGIGQACTVGNCGVAFALAPNGTQTVFHNFCSQPGCADGAGPNALIMDAAGNLYGTTANGGNPAAPEGGVVFTLDPNGVQTGLYNFCSQPGCTDGATPEAGLLMDAAGNLYGTTFNGGTLDNGVVFAVTP